MYIYIYIVYICISLYIYVCMYIHIYVSRAPTSPPEKAAADPRKGLPTCYLIYFCYEERADVTYHDFGKTPYVDVLFVIYVQPPKKAAADPDPLGDLLGDVLYLLLGYDRFVSQRKSS